MSEMRVSESMSISQRTYFSICHIQSAAFLARCAGKIERENADVEKPRAQHSTILIKHRAYVVGSILSATCFLEAQINEFFADANDRRAEQLLGLTASTMATMGTLWRHGIPRTARHGILEKYQLLLALAEVPTFDTGAPPFQDVHLLVLLRNDLVHYEPHWISADTGEDSAQDGRHQIEKMLHSKFPPNPLAGAGNPFYPDKCLGHGCAAWAVASCLALSDEFASRLSIQASYDHVRADLGVASVGDSGPNPSSD